LESEGTGEGEKEEDTTNKVKCPRCPCWVLNIGDNVKDHLL